MLYCGCILLLTKQKFSMGCVMELALQLTHTDAHMNQELQGSNSLL